MSAKTKGSLYMHTIDGKPAMYIPGQQIVFFNRYTKVNFNEVFVDSLDRIYLEQGMSEAWRKREGMTGGFESKYGYVRIRDNREVK